MTTPTPPSGPQRPTADELEVVHAYLDGEATPADRARIEADPVLVAAVDEARRSQAIVQSHLAVPPADDDRRNAHVEAALAAFDAGPALRSGSSAASAGDSTAPAVADLATHRERKAWYQRVPLPAAAAAAVILAVAVIAGVSQLGSDDRGDLTAVADDAEEGESRFEADSPMALFPEESYAESFTFDAEADDSTGLDDRLPRLGPDEPRTYLAVEDFVSDLEAAPVAFPPPHDQDARTSADPRTRPDLLLDCPDLAQDYAEFPDAYQVPAFVDGDEVVGVVFTGPDGDTVIHAIAVASCELLVEA